MVRLNLTQAARTANVSRSTLYRHIKEGRVSRTLDENNEPVIDTSELLRAYGALKQQDSAVEQPIVQPDTHVRQQDIEHEIALLKLKLEHSEALRQQVEKEKEKWQEQSERLSLLITHQREEPRRSIKFERFMKKLLGNVELRAQERLAFFKETKLLSYLYLKQLLQAGPMIP